MDISPLGKRNNYDDAYIRALIVGLVGFFYERIEVVQMENGEPKVIKVPIYYSMNGEEQFLKDYFDSYDKYRDELCLETIKGNITPIPSGIVTMTSLQINSQYLTSKFVRTNFTRRISTDFGDTEKLMSSPTAMIPMSMRWRIEIKASSDIQKLKIVEKIIKTFYRTRMFKFRYDGYDALPCMVAFPNEYDIHKENGFSYPNRDGDRPKMEFSIETLSYMPDHDEASTKYNTNRMENMVLGTKPDKDI